jgi:hypothetical protein
MKLIPRALLLWITAIVMAHFLSPAVLAGMSPDQQFAEARAAFDRGDFRKALSLGEAIIQNENLVSPVLFQFLGNTRYRQGDLGRAALWYRRAALFPPPAPETRQNLLHVRERTGNLAFPGNTFGDQIGAYLTRSQWLAIAVFSGWIFVFFLLMAYLMMRAGELRVFFVTVATLALLCGIISAVCWSNRPSYEKIKDIAVVTSPKASAYTAASVTSGSVTPLPPGSEVRKLNDRGAWSYVEIPSVNSPPLRGWVQNEMLSPFWPFKPEYLE